MRTVDVHRRWLTWRAFFSWTRITSPGPRPIALDRDRLNVAFVMWRRVAPWTCSLRTTIGEPDPDPGLGFGWRSLTWRRVSDPRRMEMWNPDWGSGSERARVRSKRRRVVSPDGRGRREGGDGGGGPRVCDHVREKIPMRVWYRLVVEGVVEVAGVSPPPPYQPGYYYPPPSGGGGGYYYNPPAAYRYGAAPPPPNPILPYFPFYYYSPPPRNSASACSFSSPLLLLLILSSIFLL